MLQVGESESRVLATEWKTLDLITEPPGKQILTVRQIRLLKVAVLAYHFFSVTRFIPLVWFVLHDLLIISTNYFCLKEAPLSRGSSCIKALPK